MDGKFPVTLQLATVGVNGLDYISPTLTIDFPVSMSYLEISEFYVRLSSYLNSNSGFRTLMSVWEMVIGPTLVVEQRISLVVELHSDRPGSIYWDNSIFGGIHRSGF